MLKKLVRKLSSKVVRRKRLNVEKKPAGEKRMLEDPQLQDSEVNVMEPLSQKKKRPSFFEYIRTSRIPRWLVILVCVPVALSFIALGVSMYIEYFVNTYPEGSVNAMSWEDQAPDYEFETEAYTYSGYGLPLPKLPDNYDTVKASFDGSFDREKMILVLRNGFVSIPYGDGQLSGSEIYTVLNRKDVPLIVTRDAAIEYALTLLDLAKLHADEDISSRFESFLEKVSKESVSRSERGSEDVRSAYHSNAINFYVALHILSPDADLSGGLRDEILDTFHEFEQSDNWNEDDRLVSALSYLHEIYSSTKSENLRMTILAASIIKENDLIDDWEVFSSYFRFFYPAKEFIDVASADKAIKSTVGYGASDDAIIKSEVIKNLSERLDTESGQGDSTDGEIDETSDVPEQPMDILDSASDSGLVKACELAGTTVEQCATASQNSLENISYAALSQWLKAGIISDSGASTYNYLKSSDWDKKVAGTWLWSVLSESLRLDPNTSVEGGESPNESGPVAEDTQVTISNDRLVFLDPNPDLYSRMEYTSLLVSGGLKRLGLLDADSETRFAGFSDDMGKLVSISKNMLAGTALTEEELGQLRTIAETIANLPNSSYKESESKIQFFAVRGGDGALLLAAGPTISYSLPTGESGSDADVFSGLSAERIALIRALFDWLPITVNSNNFDEPYDRPIVAQAPGTVRIPVLMYHQITPSPTTSLVRRLYVAPNYFEEQLAYLAARNYRSLTPQEFYDILATGKNPAQKSVMLTFDDSVSNHYTEAFPLLKKYGFVGIFYIVSQRSGITVPQMKEMADAGMIIDSHSETHRDLTKLDDASLWAEIAGSKAALESVTGKHIVSMCYPGCVVDGRGIGMVAGSGYSLGFSCGSSIDHRFSSRYVLSRIHVYDDMDNFQKIFSGIWEIPASYYQ